jgi:hypothetical protein
MNQQTNQQQTEPEVEVTIETNTICLYPKRNVYPLIVPQRCFTDKFGNVNAYVEMNPSMYMDSEGNTVILVRCVNYRKFYDKKFTMHENQSNSIYYCLRGNINDTLNKLLEVDIFESSLLNYKYSSPTYATYWKGLEDIRFISANAILVTVPECNPGGMACIFRAIIDGSNVHSFVQCSPNIVEKNWMPYFDRQRNEKVIYSLSPFQIKSVLGDDRQTIELTEDNKKKLSGYHGSTNGIHYNESYTLFLIHINKDITLHRWMLFDQTTNEVWVSSEFIFFTHAYIEFTCSLCRYENRIFISVGVNDDKAYIIESCIDDVKKMFIL